MVEAQARHHSGKPEIRPLGHAGAAAESYGIFKQMPADGKIPAGTRSGELAHWVVESTTRDPNDRSLTAPYGGKTKEGN